jgi:hypothetical protein
MRALFGIEIENDAPLAKIVVPEMQATVGMRIIVVKRTVAPGFFSTKRFYLDNVRTQTRKNLPAVLAKFVRQLDHADAVKETSGAANFILGHAVTPPVASIFT